MALTLMALTLTALTQLALMLTALTQLALMQLVLVEMVLMPMVILELVANLMSSHVRQMEHFMPQMDLTSLVLMSKDLMLKDSTHKALMPQVST